MPYCCTVLYTVHRVASVPYCFSCWIAGCFCSHGLSCWLLWKPSQAPQGKVGKRCLSKYGTKLVCAVEPSLIVLGSFASLFPWLDPELLGDKKFCLCIINVYCGAWRTTSWCALSSCQTEWIYRNWGIWCLSGLHIVNHPLKVYSLAHKFPVKRFLHPSGSLKILMNFLRYFQYFKNANRNHLLTWDKSLWAK